MAKFSTYDFFIFGDGVEYSGEKLLALVFWRFHASTERH